MSASTRRRACTIDGIALNIETDDPVLDAMVGCGILEEEEDKSYCLGEVDLEEAQDEFFDALTLGRTAAS